MIGTWLDGTRAGMESTRRRLAVALVAACALEQVAVLETSDRDVQRHWVAELARQVDRRAQAFVVTRSSDPDGAMVVHLDAMFATLPTAVPTVNGNGGNEPPGWAVLQPARVRNERVAAAFRVALDEWLRRGGVDPARVQWIRLPPRYRGPNLGKRVTPAARGEGRGGDVQPRGGR